MRRVVTLAFVLGFVASTAPAQPQPQPPQGQIPDRGRPTEAGDEIPLFDYEAYFTRYEVDSRGFELFKAGRVGGDLGGFYTIHYQTPPFEVDGQQVQLRLDTRLVSPVNYRVESRISVDGGPFRNFGTAWWTKDISGVAGAGAGSR